MIEYTEYMYVSRMGAVHFPMANNQSFIHKAIYNFCSGLDSLWWLIQTFFVLFAIMKGHVMELEYENNTISQLSLISIIINILVVSWSRNDLMYTYHQITWLY